MPTESTLTQPALDAANAADLAQPEPDAEHHLTAAPRDPLGGLAEIDAEHAFQNYGQRLPVAFSYGRGARLWDFAGHEYLDFLAGIAVTQVGHAHEEQQQADDDFNIIQHGNVIARRMMRVFPAAVESEQECRQPEKTSQKV